MSVRGNCAFCADCNHVRLHPPCDGCALSADKPHWSPSATGQIALRMEAENIRLTQLLHDVETSDLTIAVQERAELRDQRDALTMRLQASEQRRFRAEAQVRRVRAALDAPRWKPSPTITVDGEFRDDCVRETTFIELRDAIRTALDGGGDN